MELTEIIAGLESSIQNPSKGLPEQVFLLVSRITPLINVDLLIKNDRDETLLTWREDNFYTGWHIPGGIVRHGETLAERVAEVARKELRADVEFDPSPLTINEVIHPERKTRGHFISFLYGCRLLTRPPEALRCRDESPEPNEWMWHSVCPDRIISVHEMYRKFI